MESKSRTADNKKEKKWTRHHMIDDTAVRHYVDQGFLAWPIWKKTKKISVVQKVRKLRAPFLHACAVPSTEVRGYDPASGDKKMGITGERWKYQKIKISSSIDEYRSKDQKIRSKHQNMKDIKRSIDHKIKRNKRYPPAWHDANSAPETASFRPHNQK